MMWLYARESMQQQGCWPCIWTFLLLCFFTCCLMGSSNSCQDGQENHRGILNSYNLQGDHTQVVLYLTELFSAEGDGCLDGRLPSLPHYLGVALYGLGDLPGAARAFRAAVKHRDDDVASWLHLGESLLHQWEGPAAAAAVENAVLRADRAAPRGPLAERAYAHLYKARAWQADWFAAGALRARLRVVAADHVARGLPPPMGAADFLDAPAGLARALLVNSRHAALHDPARPPAHAQVLWSDLSTRPPQPFLLRIGFLSSDFGVHPVSTLIRGAIHVLAEEYNDSVEVVVFSLTNATGWWAQNISGEAASYTVLAGLSADEAARRVAAGLGRGPRALVDLNGHTAGSGLPLLARRPAPLQEKRIKNPTAHLLKKIKDPKDDSLRITNSAQSL